MKTFKEMDQTTMTGLLSFENKEMIKELMSKIRKVQLGMQIAEDGRVWLCVNGAAFLRFKPHNSDL